MEIIGDGHIFYYLLRCLWDYIVLNLGDFVALWTSSVTERMRRILIYIIMPAAAFAAPLTSNLDDDTCESYLINSGNDSSLVLSAAVSTPSGVDIGSCISQGGSVLVSRKLVTSTSTNDSAISMSTRPDGSAGFLVKGDHISASVDTRSVPEGAGIYTPSGNTINCSDFVSWMNAHRTVNLASKYLKITPGIDGFDLGARCRRKPISRQ